jgi:HD-GYP domain-containing protein (c-di-GMP phosphodiesterase class II)
MRRSEFEDMLKPGQSPGHMVHHLVLSLSDALDYVHPDISSHQLRVCYISTRLGQCLGLEGQALLDLFLAAALHDIGLVRVENRMLLLRKGLLEKVRWHAEAGYELLRDSPLFVRAAALVRHHHLLWAGGRGAERGGQEVGFGSHVIHLADSVERAIDRTIPVLEQRESIMNRIAELAPRHFEPGSVEALRQVASTESFWLDCVSDRIGSLLLGEIQWPSLAAEESAILPIAQVFAHILDAMSRWTGTHSAGVTATAVALSGRLGLSPQEQTYLRAAGYLHDLGKLSIPSRILEKADELTPAESAVMMAHPYHTFHILHPIEGMSSTAEWAAFHHERLDGTGYPFRRTAKDLSLGARTMAVADIFTAITEDRPYRAGMARGEAGAVLLRLARSGALDGDVLAMLDRDYEAINEIRQTEQAEYARTQRHLQQHVYGNASPTQAAVV